MSIKKNYVVVMVSVKVYVVSWIEVNLCIFLLMFVYTFPTICPKQGPRYRSCLFVFGSFCFTRRRCFIYSWPLLF